MYIDVYNMDMDMGVIKKNYPDGERGFSSLLNLPTKIPMLIDINIFFFWS